MFDPRTFNMDEADDLERYDAARWFLNRSTSGKDLEAQVAQQIVDRMSWGARNLFLDELPSDKRGWLER